MGARRLITRLVPAAGIDEAAAGRIAVVIDVLRASTTLTTALAAGAREVLAVIELDAARRLAAELAATGPRPLLAGERGCLRPADFDLGNSPLEMTPAAVGGRTLVASTTNGTRALLSVAGARLVLLGSFANLSATVARALAEPAGDVLLACAGVDGETALDDVACAGAFVERLAASAPFELDDGSRVAQCAAPADLGEAAVLARLSAGAPGRRLAALGHGDDMCFAARVDRFAGAVRGDVQGDAVRLTVDPDAPMKRSR